MQFQLVFNLFERRKSFKNDRNDPTGFFEVPCMYNPNLQNTAIVYQNGTNFAKILRRKY